MNAAEALDAARLRLLRDFPTFAGECLHIRGKEGGLLPFKLNSAQRHIHGLLERQRKETGRVRAIVLKGRQQGCSTYVEARFFWRVTQRLGAKAFILAHEAESSAAIFEMVERFYEHCPEFVRPVLGASNAKELHFPGLDSGYKIGTAGNKQVGRGTTIQYFHGSEVGFWPNAADLTKGVMQAVGDVPETEIILESTANGIGNFFHQQWQMAETGESKYLPVFVPWFWQPEYAETTPEGFTPTANELELMAQYGLNVQQIQWRRTKVRELAADGGDGEAAFQQEYPNNASEAFQRTGEESFIKPHCVLAARKRADVDASGPLLIGVDPARFGKDRTGIMRRRGRVAFGLETHSGLDTMAVAGLTARMIRDEKPAAVFVDVCGLGAGVVDRLFEMGYGGIVRPVNFGAAPLLRDRYANKRAECWGELAAWLKNDTLPAKIPDRDDLQADLIGPGFKYNSYSQLLLESKEDMTKRGLRSPDTADALALTFAEPVRQRDKHDNGLYPDVVV